MEYHETVDPTSLSRHPAIVVFCARPIMHACFKMKKLQNFVVNVAANGSPIIINTSFPELPIRVIQAGNPSMFRVLHGTEESTALMIRDYENLEYSSHELIKHNVLHQIEKFVDEIGALFVITPKLKEFSTIESRLLTFELLEKKMKQDIKSFSEAGFLYIGNGKTDSMECFFCGLVLKNWDDDDVPWIEHARLSPTCPFLIISNGKSLIERKFGFQFSSKWNQEEIFKLIAGPTVASTLKNNREANILKCNTDQLTEEYQLQVFSPEIISCLSQHDASAMPDYMLCKICCEKEIKVALNPCGHVYCLHCAMVLNECSMCREMFIMVIRVQIIYMDDHKDASLKQLLCSSSQSSSSQLSDKPLNPLLCKVCHLTGMGVIFIPCRHVYACVECSHEMYNCPVCSEEICDKVRVHL